MTWTTWCPSHWHKGYTTADVGGSEPMKFGLDDTQREVIEATRVLLDRMGGVDRAREFEGSVAVDSLTLNALEEAGYLDLFVESGPLEAELVAEQAGRFAVAAPVALRALVAPPILGDQSAG